jgi:hypothetical protein
MCEYSVPQQPLLARERDMTSIMRMAIAALAAVVSVPHCASAGPPVTPCSNASWDGTFGYTLTGQNVSGNNPGPRAAVGQLTADGRGNLSGNESKSSNGTISTGLTFTGTYSVLIDCTGSGTVTLSDGEVRDFNFVLIRQTPLGTITGWETVGVMAIQTDQGTVKTMSATKTRN